MQEFSEIESNTIHELEKVRSLIRIGGVRHKRTVEGVSNPEDKQKIKEMIVKSEENFLHGVRSLSLDVQEIKKSFHHYYNEGQALSYKSQIEHRLNKDYKFFVHRDKPKSLQYPEKPLNNSNIRKRPEFLIKKSFRVNPLEPPKTSSRDSVQLNTTSNIKSLRVMSRINRKI